MTDFELELKRLIDRTEESLRTETAIDLLPALEFALFLILGNLENEWTGDPETDTDVILIRAAIAKAKGD